MPAWVYTAGTVADFWLFAALAGAWIWAAVSSDEYAAQVRGIAFAAWLALLVLEPLLFLAWTASVSGASVAATIPLLPRVLAVTHFGHALLIRWLALALLGLALAQPVRGLPVIWIFAGAAVFAWSHSVTGHAGDIGDYAWPVWVDSLHFLAACAWAGGVLLAAWRPADTADFRGYAQAVQRLSLLAALLLAIVVATGIVNAMHMLRQPADLVDTGYGRLLDWKLLAVVLTLMLAALNRYLLLPRLVLACGLAPRRGPLHALLDRILLTRNTAPAPEAAARALRLSLGLEALALLTALTLAGLLRQAMPPMPGM